MESKQSKRGGAREGAGRPATGRTPCINVTCDDATRGKANETVESNGITVSIWRESQAYKGDRRRDVYVADMGDCRAVYVF